MLSVENSFESEDNAEGNLASGIAALALDLGWSLSCQDRSWRLLLSDASKSIVE